MDSILFSLKNKLFTLVCLFSLIFISNGYAQWELDNVELKPDGKITLSKETIKGNRYRITIEGTYSMWPQYTDCHGVDAAYIYDVPKEEIDALRWPPEKIKIGTLEIPLFPLPHWVGDPQVWKIPPEELGTPLFKFSLRQYKGFRLDDEPLPNLGFQNLTHRYQIEKQGTGNSFQFQILDSNRSIIEEKTLPRYEDNCGILKITIEDLDFKKNDTTGNNGKGDKDVDINIKTVEPWKYKNLEIGTVIQLSLDLQDSTSLTGKKNILGELNPNEIIVISDGKIICDIDSIICNDRKEPFAIGLLIDNTESMQGPISDKDNTQRMKASKSSLTHFVDNLLPEDDVLLMSFNQDTKVESNWSKDKSLLKSKISDLQSEDKLTSVYKAISIALDSLSLNKSPNKALIVLSDGGNTYPPSWNEIEILKIASQKNIPIFVIALGFTKLPIDIDGSDKLGQIVKSTPNGKIFPVYNSKELDSIYIKLSKEIISEEDCYIYFKNDTCKPGTERWIRILYAPNDSTIVTKVVKYKCPNKTSVKEFELEDKEIGLINNFEIIPNPAYTSFEIKYNLLETSNHEILLYTINGELVSRIHKGYSSNNIFTYSCEKLIPGTYLVVLKTDQLSVMRKLQILK